MCVCIPVSLKPTTQAINQPNQASNSCQHPTKRTTAEPTTQQTRKPTNQSSQSKRIEPFSSSEKASAADRGLTSKEANQALNINYQDLPSISRHLKSQRSVGRTTGRDTGNIITAKAKTHCGRLKSQLRCLSVVRRISLQN